MLSLRCVGIVGDAVERNRVGTAHFRGSVTDGGANYRGGIDLPAVVPADRGVMEEIVLITALGIETRKLGKIVELMKRAGEGDILIEGAKISAVDGVFEFRNQCGAVLRGDVDDSREGVTAVQYAIGTAQDFDTVHAVVGKLRKSKAPPMLFTGMPSTRTLLKLDWPPRMNKEVAPPR